MTRNFVVNGRSKILLIDFAVCISEMNVQQAG